MRRALTGSLILAGVALGGPAQAQFCPCYTASSPNNSHGCAIEAVAGTDPTEAEWLDIFDLVAQGPAVWGTAGPDVSDIGQGCGKPEAYHEVPARFPCELLMAIATIETGWRQFCVPTTPSDQVGGAARTIISFDCGYGVAQVTSGMHDGETPSFDRDRVAADPTYNLATGTRILASKWRNTQCVGDNQPAIIEHWYTATWAYNGLSYSNNPNNPAYDPNRGVYDPQIGGSAPYQEKVFGRMEHTGGKWAAIGLAYPNPGEIGGGSSPPELSEPSCASPTDCVNSRTVHLTACDGQQGGGGTGGGASTSSGAGGMASSSTSSGSSSGSSSGAGGQGEVGAIGLTGDNGGCGCRVIGSERRGAAARWLLGLLVCVALGMRRRARRTP